MKSAFKVIILLELIVGYSPIFYMLVLSLIMSSFMLLSVFTGATTLLVPLLATILGALGCVGMFQVVIKILDRDVEIKNLKLIKLFLLCGLAALIIGVIYMQAFEFPQALMFLLPTFVLVHFVYLLKGYLFKRRS